MPPKKRLDTDGRAYTQKDFKAYYGGLDEWNRAPEADASHSNRHAVEPAYVPTGGSKRKEPNFARGFERGFRVPKRLAKKSENFIETVNDWHYAMLNDHPRNEHYHAALKEVIQPGETVCLEIGAGSGILSCIAASLGAKKVVAIEANANLALLSRQIVEANGFSNVVTILEGMSSEMTLKDIGEPADVLLSELFGTLLLGESALHYISHARHKLLKKDAKIVPQRALQYAQLVHSSDLVSLTSAKEWNGINLKPFNALQDTSSLIFSKAHGFRFNTISHTMLSENIPIMEVDFCNDDPKSLKETRHRLTVSESGTVHAVLATWEAFSEGAESMSTHPDATINNLPRDMHWGQGIQLMEDTSTDGPVPVPLTVTKGEVLDLVVTHATNAITLQFRIERVSPAPSCSKNEASTDSPCKGE